VHSIVNVADGNVVLGADVGRHLLATTDARPQRPFPTLTPREYEILDRLARGLANGAIAARMGISVKTVQNSVSGILLKLGVADRGQAVAVARDAWLGVGPR
jgi:DNA-binding NarL/FixJ family response regulator